MPIRDIAAMNRSLDNDYGATHGPNSPDSHDLALFLGDPMSGATECTGPGYARVVLPNDGTGWDAAAEGYKDVHAPAQFPAPTGAWPPCTHWALFDHDHPTQMWDCGPLQAPLNVTEAAGVGPTLGFSVYYDDAVLEAP